MDIFSLDGKVIVVTGASGLLGREHVAAIASRRGIPVLIDLDQKVINLQIKQLFDEFGITALGFSVDITNEEEVSNACLKVVSYFGKIDGLVNNAANNPKVESSESVNFSRVENFPINIWETDINVSLKGSFLCIKYFGHQISKNPNGGNIVNISSDLGLISPDQRLYKIEGLQEDLQPVKPITYSVVKTGLIGLTRYISTYWADKNVRCNAICPGGVENNQNKDFVEELIKRIPLNRMARKDEYHGIVVFLLSDASSYINGAVIAADGGRTIW